MANPWYSVTYTFKARTLADGSQLQFELGAIETALDDLATDLPALAQTYSTFDGVTLPVMTGKAGYAFTAADNETDIELVSPTAFFLEALPDPSGNGGKAIALAGGETSFQYLSLTHTLGSGSFTAESSAEILLPSGFEYVQLVIHGFFGSTTGVPTFQVDVDGTLQTGAVYNGSRISHTSSATISILSAASNVGLVASLGSSDARPMSIIMDIFNSGTAYPQISFRVVSSESNSTRCEGKVSVNATGDITSITLSPASGTITGEWATYGIALS